VRRKWSAPPSGRSSRATAVTTTCASRILRVASATLSGSSISNGNGLAVVTAQNPQARVQRSPAIMKVAVPLVQHSQWLGHLALSQTVWSRSSSSSARVRAKLALVGKRMRSQSGRRGRGVSSAGFNRGILLPLEFSPKIGELVGAKIGKDFAIDLDDRGKFLAGEAHHFIIGSFIGHDIDFLVIDAMRIQPACGF